MLVGTTVRRVAIVGGVRIPFARAHTAYADVGNQEMLTAVLRALVERFGLAGARLGDVAAGAVIKHSRDYNLMRECVLVSGLDPQTPGLDLQRACGTSLEAAILIGNKIALGQIDCGIAGGVDTISDPPVVYPRAYQQLLLASARGRTLGAAPGAVAAAAAAPLQAGAARGRRAAHRTFDGPEHASSWRKTLGDRARGAGSARLREPPEGGGRLARGLLRRSGRRRTSASRRDNNIRADTSLEKLAQAAAGFDPRDGTLTAGNSTPLTDGARGGAAGFGGVGGASAICRCSPGCATARCGPSTSPAARRAC